MNPAPVQSSQRIHYLDVVRGFAITGVLIAFISWNLGTAPESVYTSFDITLDKVLVFLVDSKCYTILANLFAVGFVLHMSKPGNPARRLNTYRKRLAGLLIIGIIHAVFLRNGDILAPYALLTLLVSLFYQSSTRTIIIAMVITFLLPALVPEIYMVLHLSQPQRPVSNENSNYLSENLAWVKYFYTTLAFFWETTLFFLFSGLLLGRVFIQNKKKLNDRQLMFITTIGLIAGVAGYWIPNAFGNLLARIPDIGNTFILRKLTYDLLMLIHRAGLATTYAIVLYLLLKRFSLDVLATLGRTSLSNYIMQAVIVVPVCLAFNLFDHITPTIALIMTITIWIFQVLFSSWWLKIYQFGPLEWVLRRFTYGKTVTAKKSKIKDGLVVGSESF